MRSRASDSRLWIGPSRTEGRPRDGSSNLPGAILFSTPTTGGVAEVSPGSLGIFDARRLAPDTGGFRVRLGLDPSRGSRPSAPRPRPPLREPGLAPRKTSRAVGRGRPPGSWPSPRGSPPRLRPRRVPSRRRSDPAPEAPLGIGGPARGRSGLEDGGPRPRGTQSWGSRRAGGWGDRAD